MHDWIDGARDRARRLGEGAAPHLPADWVGCAPGDEDPESGPDPRPAWLARLGEAFPPGAGGEPAEDWAAVSRRIAEPNAGEHRVETARTTLHALAGLAAAVADGWVPVMVVDLRSGAGWRAVLTAHTERLVRW